MTGAIPHGVRVVFFDAVGTLLFPEPPALDVYAAVAAHHGLALPPAEAQSRFVAAYRAEEAADRDAGWVTSESREVERWRRIVVGSLTGVGDGESCFRELYSHFERSSAWRLAPPAARVIAELAARGLTLGLGSNYDSRLNSVLDGFPELAPLRDRVVVSAGVGFRKPAGAFFAEVVRRAGCAPAEVLFVGDDYQNDYEGATDAGLVAVLLDPTGRHPEVSRRVGDLRELLDQ